MGLHNKFPPHFYKRGNLFNTYLGYSDDQPLPSRAKRKSAEAPQSERKRAGGTARPIPPRSKGSDSAAQRIAVVARDNLSRSDTARLLHLIADRAGVPTPRRDDLDWRDLGRFVSGYVPAKTAETYARELEGRLARGEALIQK